MPTSIDKYLDPTGLDETVLNIRQITEGLEADMQNLPYARPGGIYPDMTVGAVIGADETAQWAQRESTGSGGATVRSVQGAAVGWNQLYNREYGDSTASGVSFTHNSDGSWTANGTATANGNKVISNVPTPINHKLLIKGTPSGGGRESYFMGLGGFYIDGGNGGIWTNTTIYTILNLRIDFISGTVFDNVTFWPQTFDLTAMFGAGNEPQSVAEFEAMYPEAYYPYSAPTLKPVQIAGIRSTDAQGGELGSVEWTAQTLRAAGNVADVLYADHVDVNVGSCTIAIGDGVTFSSSDTPNSAGLYNHILQYTAAAWASSGLGNATYNASHWLLNANSVLGISNATGASGATTAGFQALDNSMHVYFRWPSLLTQSQFEALVSGAGAETLMFALATPTTQPISPALPMTYKVQGGGSEAIIVPDGEVSAAPVLTVAEPVNAGDEFARIWEAIQSLGYTRNTAQLSRPVSLTDTVSIDETQKDTTDVVEIDTTKEVQG